MIQRHEEEEDDDNESRIDYDRAAVDDVPLQSSSIAAVVAVFAMCSRKEAPDEKTTSEHDPTAAIGCGDEPKTSKESTDDGEGNVAVVSTVQRIVQRKVSWHTSVTATSPTSSSAEEHRRHRRRHQESQAIGPLTPGPVRRISSLKPIGNQRSASLESVKSLAAAGSSVAVAADHHHHHLIHQQQQQQQQYSSVVKELRRSSELLRNILLGLSSKRQPPSDSALDTSASSSSSSSSSAVTAAAAEVDSDSLLKARPTTTTPLPMPSVPTASASASASGGGGGVQPSSSVRPSISASLLEVTPDLQAALQSHRKRRWFSPGESSTTTAVPSQSQTAFDPTLTTIELKGDDHYQLLLLLQMAIVTGDVTRVRQLVESGTVDPDRPVVIPAAEAAGQAADYPDLLHWCAAQTPTPWPSILVLLENGCRCPKRLQRLAFASSSSLSMPVSDGTFSRIQQQLISDAFAYLLMHYAGYSFKGAVGSMGSSSAEGSVGAAAAAAAAAIPSSSLLQNESLELDFGSQLHVAGSCGGGPGALLPMQDTFSASSAAAGHSTLQQQQQQQQRAATSSSTATGNLFRRLHQSAATTGRAVKQNVPITGLSIVQSTAATSSPSAGAAAAVSVSSQTLATGKSSLSSSLTCSTPYSTAITAGGSGVVSSVTAAGTANVSATTTPAAAAAANINKFKEQLNFSFDADSSTCSPRVEITSIKASATLL